jgi:hypothetical protein
MQWFSKSNGQIERRKNEFLVDLQIGGGIAFNIFSRICIKDYFSIKDCFSLLSKKEGIGFISRSVLSYVVTRNTKQAKT